MAKTIQVFETNTDTGETRQVFVETNETKNKKQAKIEKYKNDLAEKQRRLKEYGAFVWLVYNCNDTLFDKIKPANLTRLIYLSTYLNYEGYIVDNSNLRAIKKEKIKEILGVEEATFWRFWKECSKDYDILVESNGKVFFNEEYFDKGKLPKTDDNVIKLYVDGIRSIYNSSSIKSHKQLSYIFRIIPWINRRYNIVCNNPLETDINKIDFMTLGKFCNIINYKKENINILKKDMLSVKIDGMGYMVTFLVRGADAINTWRMTINPKIYYAGTDYSDVYILSKF